jgi:homoserine kinase type II
MFSQPPATVLARWAQCRGATVAPLGGAGGFTGAAIWKLSTSSKDWCLKAWPDSGPTVERLIRIHGWMDQARATGLRFVPAVARTSDGHTIVEHGGRLWDLCQWMPGRAGFRDRPTTARVEAACTAVAQLHGVWRATAQTMGEPPSIARRLQAAAEWRALVASGWVPSFGPPALDPITEPARTAWGLLPRLVPGVGPTLAPWVGRPLPMHPCLCDVWHDHVLFTGDDVTGIIDYGSMRLDHPATDLARLLGDLAVHDPTLYDAGLAAYRRLAPLSPDDASLVHALDRTGTILAAVRWLVRLYRNHEPFDDRERVAARLRLVVERLSQFR